MELLAARNLSKYFPSTGVLATDKISLSVGEGEILALVGENGAGKSTLARIIAGLVKPDSGEILMRGRSLIPGLVRVAEAAGVGLVPQHSFLATSLPLYEALALGREPRKYGFLFDRKRARTEARELALRHGFHLDPDTPVGVLSASERRRAEILRVLAWGGDLIMLDEPTSLLTEEESESLFELARNLAAHGKALVFITHRVGELRAIATRIAILRDGRLVADRRAEDFSDEELPLLMSRSHAGAGLAQRPSGEGRASFPGPTRPSPATGLPSSATAPLAEARELVLTATGCERPLSFMIGPGDCLGILALAGNGLAELEAVASGLASPLGGSFLIGGEAAKTRDRAELRCEMMAYVPADREGFGLALEASGIDNLLALERSRADRWSWLSSSRRRNRARRLTQVFGPAAGLDGPVSNLSGGNRQRLLLSRELGANRPLLLLADPTQGLDLEAVDLVARRLEEERAAGKGVLLLTSSVEEVTLLADRIAVLYRGSLVWEGPNRGPAMAGELTAHLTGLSTFDGRGETNTTRIAP